MDGTKLSPSDRLQRAQQDIEARIQRSGAESVGVVYHDLTSGQELSLNADTPFNPASTFKVCVMMELYRQAREGGLSLDDRLPIRNTFASIVDGSPYSLAEEDDAEPSLYARRGETETLRELCRLMIVRSGNLATNLLIDVLGAANVTQFMRELGAPDIQVVRGTYDTPAIAIGRNNVVTARGLARILARLAEGSVVSPDDSRAMVDVLLAQQFNEGIPAGLRAAGDAWDDAKVAHKTGWITRHYHDAALVFPSGRSPFVLVVLTRGLEASPRAWCEKSHRRLVRC